MQRFLEEKSGSQRNFLVRDLTNGTTPLIIAAKNGHSDCVEYLVDKCKANVEQVGSSEWRGKSVVVPQLSEGDACVPLCRCSGVMKVLWWTSGVIRYLFEIIRTTS